MWSIANGRCSWTVAPTYHGGVTAWREVGSNVNHLMTAFPENGELGWLKPWFGGIWPIITPMGVEQDGWPGKMHEETFMATPFETTDERGISWRGVRVVAPLKREGFEGLRAEIAYLTVGSSNVLKVVYRLSNETSVYRRFRLGLLAFCQVDGQHRDTVLYGKGFQRKRTLQMSRLKIGPWGAVTNPSSGRAIVHVVASGKKRIELVDWGVDGGQGCSVLGWQSKLGKPHRRETGGAGARKQSSTGSFRPVRPSRTRTEQPWDGGHLFAYNHAVLSPSGSHELIAYLALAESLEEAKRYGSFAESKV